MRVVAQLGLVARRGFGRIVPDPFAIAVGLTVLVMVAALAFGRPPTAMLEDWGGGQGLWALLVFTMQMCLMLVLGTALASAPVVRRGLGRVVGWAGSPRQLVGLTAGAAIGLALLNWSLGLVGGALLAREAGQVARRRGWRVHYPLLCAAGYSGLMVWHGGLSGSAPLKVTGTRDLVEVLGAELAAEVGVMPLSETLLSSLNLVVTGGLLVLGPLLFMALTPHGDHDADAEAAPALSGEVHDEPAPRGGLERLERSAWVTFALSVPMVAVLVLRISEGGWARIDFNTVNLALWTVALLLHRRPFPFLRACEEGVRGCTGVILQFPLYAGIMGVMAGSGLSSALSRAFAGVGAGAYAPLAFLSAGLLNLFVPSGGGQWAVQGPILMQGAVELGLEPATLVMAMAYGDEWTNMLQPFWALPLLAITGVRARDIVGYSAVWMLVGGLWMLAGLTFAGG